MVCSCSAYNCRERQKQGSGISFHSFPKDEQLQKKWLIAMKRKDFVHTASTKICSRHFQSSDFVYSFGRKTLCKDSVPSVFDFPPHLRPKVTAQRKRRRINTDEASSQSVLEVEKELLIVRATTSIEQQATSSKEKPHVEATSEKRPEVCCDQKFVQTVITGEGQEYKHFNDKKRRKYPHYFGDFTEKDLNSSIKVRKMWLCARKTIDKHKQTTKYLQNRTYKLSRKIQSLRDVILHLKNTRKISDHCFSVLQECTPLGVQQLLLRNMGVSKSKQYPEELRIFALTLNFYSSSAYNYIRKTFAKCLPHPKTIQKWYRAVDGSPGYTQESLRALEIKVSEFKKEDKVLVCGLIMDEMSIRQHVQWNGQRQTGYINYGFGVESDSLPVAKDALVFLLVAQNCKWKIPMGYFLINGLNASEKANLVKGCFTMLHSIGIVITSLTFDGAAANLSMARHLGADLHNFSNLRTYFPHPVTNKPIFILLDACHMIKLIRNTLGDWGFLYDKNNHRILWRYFEDLVELQEQTGLHAATKIRRRHINYRKEIMKVKLATQIFSVSVSDALNYCCQDLKLEQFKNANYTADFCLMMNNIFDVMNTRNSLSGYLYKKSLSKYNFNFIKKFFAEAKTYISNISGCKGENILVSSRKTGFLGLLINMSSIEGIINHHIITQPNLKYLLTYKLSQDHLEMFFSNIRSRGGFTNNPTAIQFESAYKKILIHTELSSSEAANCLALDETSILRVVSTQKIVNQNLDLICYDAQEFEEEISLPLPNVMETYIFDITEYIAGFIVKKLKRSFKCDVCVSYLTENVSSSTFLNKKNKGGLTKPSYEVTKLCHIAERIFRSTVEFSSNNIIDRLVIEATRRVNFRIIFTDLSEHIKEQNPINNHLIQMVYLILKHYFCIRLNHKNKSLQEKEVRVRHVFTKLIHFKHQ